MNWENQFILYCKGHFSGVAGEKLSDLRYLFAKRCGLESVTNKDVASYLLSAIVHPFILPNISEYLFTELIEGIAPDEVWKVGYPNAMPYDYYSAVVYKLASVIKHSEVKYFPPDLLTAKADTQLLMGSARPVSFA